MKFAVNNKTNTKYFPVWVPFAHAGNGNVEELWVICKDSFCISYRENCELDIIFTEMTDGEVVNGRDLAVSFEFQELLAAVATENREDPLAEMLTQYIKLDFPENGISKDMDTEEITRRKQLFVEWFDQMTEQLSGGTCRYFFEGMNEPFGGKEVLTASQQFQTTRFLDGTDTVFNGICRQNENGGMIFVSLSKLMENQCEETELTENPDGYTLSKNLEIFCDYYAENRVHYIGVGKKRYGKRENVSVCRYIGKGISVVKIPPMYSGAPVSRIDEDAFRECDIEEIYLPEGVEIIGNHAFEDCLNLKKIHLPMGIKQIDIETIPFDCVLVTECVCDFVKELCGSDRNIHNIGYELEDGTVVGENVKENTTDFMEALPPVEERGEFSQNLSALSEEISDLLVEVEQALDKSEKNEQEEKLVEEELISEAEEMIPAEEEQIPEEEEMIPAEEEQIPEEEEMIPVEEEQIPEAEEMIPAEEEQIPEEEEMIPVEEELISEAEEMIPAEEEQIPEEEMIPAEEEQIPKEEMIPAEEERIQKVEEEILKIEEVSEVATVPKEAEEIPLMEEEIDTIANKLAELEAILEARNIGNQVGEEKISIQIPEEKKVDFVIPNIMPELLDDVSGIIEEESSEEELIPEDSEEILIEENTVEEIQEVEEKASAEENVEELPSMEEMLARLEDEPVEENIAVDEPLEEENIAVGEQLEEENIVVGEPLVEENIAVDKPIEEIFGTNEPTIEEVTDESIVERLENLSKEILGESTIEEQLMEEPAIEELKILESPVLEEVPEEIVEEIAIEEESEVDEIMVPEEEVVEEVEEIVEEIATEEEPKIDEIMVSEEEAVEEEPVEPVATKVSPLRITIGEKGNSFIALNMPIEMLEMIGIHVGEADTYPIMLLGNYIDCAIEDHIIKYNLLTKEMTRKTVDENVVVLLNSSVSRIAKWNDSYRTESSDFTMLMNAVLSANYEVLNDRLRMMDSFLKFVEEDGCIKVKDETGEIHSMQEVLWMISQNAGI